ncbi:dephospho-CoA kinase [Wolbachia endosymbiont of Howardula sp.]|uniref:dephospho-CoA kinase n=1 Tax=Wolbachia endosymbiont of Howardula sp. TaxID=2916816 RepID=UPI0031FD8924
MIIGLTGGMGVGKTFIASCFAQLGASVFYADDTVHSLYKTDKKIIDYARTYFVDTIINNEINRNKLSQYFLLYDETWKRFQSLVHTTVLNKLNVFIDNISNQDNALIVLDIPLLLETQFHLYCNLILFVHVDYSLQLQRLHSRHININYLKLVNYLQLPSKAKRKMSTYAIDGSLNKHHIFFQVQNIVHALDYQHYHFNLSNIVL